MRLAVLIYRVLLVTAPFAIATNISFQTGFSNPVCRNRTLNLISNGSLALDDEVFFRDAAGRPMNQEDNLTLTKSGCDKLCGPKQRWYSDVGPRLSAWLIPIFLLLSNVELSPLDKRRFLALIHLLGDPIDSIWSLVHKVDSSDRCYNIAEGYQGICERCKLVFATVLAGMEEIEGPLFNANAGSNLFVSKHDLIVHFEEWRRAAFKLADSRTNELPRTCLAILLYFYQLVACFVKEVGGGNSSPPGGRIATGVFLSWLIPVVLLSNAIGNFPSRRTCYDILVRFAGHTGIPLCVSHGESVLFACFEPLSRRETTDYFHSLGWSGGIHSFRPWKYRDIQSKQRRLRAFLVLLLAASPLLIGMAGASVILWVSLPIGLNCRHTWVIGIFLAWCVSPIVTWISLTPRFVTGKYHWHFVLVKDALIAVPSLVVIFLSAAGLFNSCYCWSGYFYYGENARVLLSSDQFWNLKGHTTYPMVVGICIALQLASFGITVILLRRGLKLFRWSELRRCEEWKRGPGDNMCQCMRGTKSGERDIYAENSARNVAA